MMQDRERLLMLQQAPTSWLEHNFWQLVQFIIMVAVAVGSFVTLREGQKANTKEIDRLDTRFEYIEKELEGHCSDRQIHIDTVRDERRLATIERKLDVVLDRLDRMK